MRYFILAAICAAALLLIPTATSADWRPIPKWHPPHRAAWLCIYSYENGGYGWKANTGNGYYGGLQMDLSFQRAYGWGLLRTKGTANHWTAHEQMWVAERAWRTRGFYPWPNTARYCGLI